MLHNKALSLLCASALVAGALLGCSCSETSSSPRASATPRPGMSTQTASPNDPAAGFTLPQGLEMGEDGVPMAQVYVVEEHATRTMDIETYLQGVLAGEMQSSWPLEALKAQAILARTFAVKFMRENGGSKYAGADLSTDIEEAQAYDASGVDDNIRRAIEETRGKVILYEGEPIFAWFHAHSGGKTATAKEGLAFEDDEPPYIRSVDVDESPKAEAEAQHWEASFPFSAINEALKNNGGGSAEKLAIENYGPSGRVVTFTAGVRPVSAPALRLALGSAELRSTYITELIVGKDAVTFKGKGYGHGVGMSQWGAYAQAEAGNTAEEIIDGFFEGVTIAKVWG